MSMPIKLDSRPDHSPDNSSLFAFPPVTVNNDRKYGDHYQPALTVPILGQRKRNYAPNIIMKALIRADSTYRKPSGRSRHIGSRQISRWNLPDEVSCSVGHPQRRDSQLLVCQRLGALPDFQSSLLSHGELISMGLSVIYRSCDMSGLPSELPCDKNHHPFRFRGLDVIKKIL